MVNRKIGILIGSARKQAFSGQVARAVAAQFPEQLTPVFMELEHLPMYNQDYDDEGTTPESWTAFRETLKGCAAFVCYPRAQPLRRRCKNAIDIASRPMAKLLER